MTTNSFDAGMQQSIRLCSADCEEINIFHASDLLWPLAVFNGTQPYSPVLPIVFCPYPVLQHHGYIRWVITGTYEQTAVATSLRVRPITRTGLGANQALATGSTNMNFSTGAGALAAGHRFRLEIECAVIGDTSGTNQQFWKGNLTVCDAAGTEIFNVNATGLSTIDQNVTTDLGLYLSFATGAPTISVKSVTAHHFGQRNDS